MCYVLTNIAAKFPDLDAGRGTGRYLHMGIAVGGGATDFEIEYVEVRRSGFAGIRLINEPSDGVDKPMANVRVHDVYVLGDAANVTSTNNRNEDAGAIELLDGPWQTPGHHLTYWAPEATVTGGADVTYNVDDVVVYGDPWTLYRATATSTGMAPPGAAWTVLPPPTDDVRVKPGTTYADLGVR